MANVNRCIFTENQADSLRVIYEKTVLKNKFKPLHSKDGSSIWCDSIAGVLLPVSKVVVGYLDCCIYLATVYQCTIWETCEEWMGLPPLELFRIFNHGNRVSTRPQLLLLHITKRKERTGLLLPSSMEHPLFPKKHRLSSKINAQEEC